MTHAELLGSRERSTKAHGFTLWFTGLSGAGKSTLAAAVSAELRRRGIPVEVLDGDEVRQNLSKGLGFSREDRDTNIRRIGYVAKLLARNGVAVITAAISPYRAIRDEVRQDIGAFVEVYVKATLDECIRRDTKGLYARALAGEIPQFTGVSDPYEEPAAPELVIDTEHEEVADSASRVIDRLLELGYLRSPGDA
jgi:adenylyl-sulfate kinase